MRALSRVMVVGFVLGVVLISAAGASAQQFQVVGTCADGPCGLNIRNGPGYSNYARIGGLYDGNAVDVICQTRGQLVTPGRTAPTTVWDQIVPAGSYVTDAYINTPGRVSGTFSLPRCPPAASITSPGNGGAFNQGTVVDTSFLCSEALGEGDSLQSCSDSNGVSGGSGTLNTSEPGAHTYTVTTTSTDGATGSASINYTVIGAPTATITSPASGGRYLQGSVVNTGFACAEGLGGPGIKSCTDANGDSAGSGTLDTSTVGPHTYSVSAESADGATSSTEISYTVASAKEMCTGNTGKITYTPGLTNTPTVQVVKINGTLSGCTGSGTMTGAKYAGTLKTAKGASCATLTSPAGEPAIGPVVLRWIPKTKGPGSTGTLSLNVTEAPGASLEGTLESGPLSPANITGTIAQTFTKAASCGIAVGAKSVRPVKTSRFTGSGVELY